jgi:hypothetical protein
VSIDTKETSCLGIKIPRQNKKRYRQIAVKQKARGLAAAKNSAQHTLFFLGTTSHYNKQKYCNQNARGLGDKNKNIMTLQYRSYTQDTIFGTSLSSRISQYIVYG